MKAGRERERNRRGKSEGIGKYREKREKTIKRFRIPGKGEREREGGRKQR